MKGTGIFVTTEELDKVKAAYNTSGMYLSGGQPMGNPQEVVYQLTLKYKPPSGSGLNIKTGEFVFMAIKWRHRIG